MFGWRFDICPSLVGGYSTVASGCGGCGRRAMLLASVVAGIIVNVFGVFASFRSGVDGLIALCARTRCL